MENKKLISKRKRLFKISLKFLLTIFMVVNIISIFHAYNFTHLYKNVALPPNPSQMSIGQKASALFTGVRLQKNASKMNVNEKYQTIFLDSNKQVEAWYKGNEHNKGTVVFFHGYVGNKAQMQSRARYIYSLGYNTLLVDNKGSGNSAGNTITVGYYESEDVKLAMDYLEKRNSKNIYLFGSSMGAATVMRSVAVHKIKPKGIIVECPFGSMLQTTKNRFDNMHVPSFGLAHCLVFWGGAINKFNGFEHNPQDYAKDIQCPSLLIWGEHDERVLPIETETIYNHLAGPKTLLSLKNSSHFDFLDKDKDAWEQGVKDFLESEALREKD